MKCEKCRGTVTDGTCLTCQHLAGGGLIERIPSGHKPYLVEVYADKLCKGLPDKVIPCAEMASALDIAKAQGGPRTIVVDTQTGVRYNSKMRQHYRNSYYSMPGTGETYSPRKHGDRYASLYEGWEGAK